MPGSIPSSVSFQIELKSRILPDVVGRQVGTVGCDEAWQDERFVP